MYRHYYILMNRNTANKKKVRQSSGQQEIDWLVLFEKIYTSKKQILLTCSIGAVIGLIVALGTPKEYTASIFIVPESSRRATSSGISTLSDVVGTGMNSSSTTERDAIYSVLYPAIIHSTPFLVRLFDIKIRGLKDNTVITLSQYLKEHQKCPWWNSVTSIPSKLVGWCMTMIQEKPKVEKVNSSINIFQLTREEAAIAGIISSRTSVGIDETGRRRKITLSVTMQDPQVAAIVVDTILEHLKEYVTEYRTSKSRRMLEYTEKLRKEAQAEYYKAQEKYTRYADINQGLVRQTSRAELTRLRNEMNLALTIYNQTELQVQAAEVKVKKATPVLAVIQPPIVPLTPSKPRKMVILAGCIFLAGAGSISWILFAKDFVEGFLRNIRRKRKTSEDEYNQMVAND